MGDQGTAFKADQAARLFSVGSPFIVYQSRVPTRQG